MPHRRTLVLLVLAALFAASGCAVPAGSRARPARAMTDGRLAIGGGGLVPIGFLGQFDLPGDDKEPTTIKSDRAGAFVPVGSFDYAIGDGEYAGVDISYSEFLAGQVKTILVNPRFEYPFGGKDRYLALTLDGNIMYVRRKDDAAGFPFMQPMIGLRAYFELFEYFGIVLSQSIGTAIVSFYAPGGVSLDVAIPFGEDGPRLHVMPELRWDPTAFWNVAQFIMFSAGGVIMLEI